MSEFRKKLQAGRPVLGLMKAYPGPGEIERVGPDWDWVWIDGQHGELDYRDVLDLVRACELVGCAPVVRVPSHERGGIGRVLDLSAAGVIVPQVETADEARAVVQSAKFPPLGDRSYGGRRVSDRRGRLYCETDSTDTLLIVQIESPAAVERADEIAAVPGVDGLLLGPDDVALRRGRPMAAPDPADLAADVERVVAACLRHGKHPVLIAMTPELQATYYGLGVRMLAIAADLLLLAEGSQRAAADARAVLEQQKPASPRGGGAASPY